MKYNQFCPIAKALEILGDKWTLLIIREFIKGSTRFNQLQRGLPSISPTLLTKRLVALEQQGLLLKKRIPQQRGFEYFPTQACTELVPVIDSLGIWGVHWTKEYLIDEDYDLELLMFFIEGSIQTENLISPQTVIRFNFTDVSDYPNWWIVINGADIDVCVQDPNKDVDVYFNVSVKTMCHLFMGDISYRQAIADKQLQLLGPKPLINNVAHWLKPSRYANVEPLSEVMVSTS